MEKDELKSQRRRLQQIYVSHDVEGFREFLSERVAAFPAVAKFVRADAETLSDLMYEEKSKLMYLGEVWQDARNHKRMKQVWKDSEMTDEVAEAFVRDGELPKCMTCKFYYEPPSENEEDFPCMQVGAAPQDICCKAYKPQKQGISNMEKDYQSFDSRTRRRQAVLSMGVNASRITMPYCFCLTNGFKGVRRRFACVFHKRFTPSSRKFSSFARYRKDLSERSIPLNYSLLENT